MQGLLWVYSRCRPRVYSGCRSRVGIILIVGFKMGVVQGVVLSAAARGINWVEAQGMTRYEVDPRRP